MKNECIRVGALAGKRLATAMVTLMGCWQLWSCASGPENPVPTDQLPKIYPDYVGVTIPTGIAPLNFNLID